MTFIVFSRRFFIEKKLLSKPYLLILFIIFSSWTNSAAIIAFSPPFTNGAKQLGISPIFSSPKVHSEAARGQTASNPVKTAHKKGGLCAPRKPENQNSRTPSFPFHTHLTPPSEIPPNRPAITAHSSTVPHSGRLAANPGGHGWGDGWKHLPPNHHRHTSNNFSQKILCCIPILSIQQEAV